MVTSPYTFVVAAALIDQSGRILLAKRSAYKAMAGLWEFPGGKVDDGETPDMAIIRELKEELGITVSAKDLKPLTFVSHTYDTFHLFMPLYICHAWQGEPKALEHEDLAWVHADSLNTYEMPEADEPFIDALQSYLKTIAIPT